MTVCGFRKCDAFAFAWADGEVYRDDEPVDSMVKLAVSPAGLVGMGAGFADLTRQFLDLVKGFSSKSFEGAVSALPAQLRAARTEKIKHARGNDYFYDVETTYALIGCSSGHLRGAVFYERRDFEAAEADFWASPYVDAEPETASAVLAVAQRQLTYVQRKCPDATGRELTIARIGPNGVAQTRVPLLLPRERVQAA